MDIVQLPEILSNASPKDKPWEAHRMVADLAQSTFLSSKDEKQIRRGERMKNCAQELIFKLVRTPDSDEIKHKLRSAKFCRVRFCPTCMWRKSLAWRARFYRAWPSIIKKHSDARYFHLVLTYPNCRVEDLRETLTKMNKAWNRMLARNTWPALGFIRTVEVTKDNKGFAHPHFHVLMMVSKDYFRSAAYMTRGDWREYWLSALELPTDSNLIHPFIRAIHGEENLAKAVLEVTKYAIKMKSMKGILSTKPGRKWFLEMDSQLEKTRGITLGGIINQFMNGGEDITDEELLMQENALVDEVLKDAQYDWVPGEKWYLRSRFLSQKETEFWNEKEKEWRDKRIRKRKKSSPDTS